MSRGPLVLMYHGVDRRREGADPDNLFVPPAAFRAHLLALLGRGWRAVGLDELLSGRCGRRSFLVTFDDGYVSVADNAAPILADLQVPAVCFVCPGVLGTHSSWAGAQPEPLLDAAGVAALGGAGIEVGAHGWDHTPLPGLDADALRRNTRDAAGALADLTGRRPRAFAYPYGRHDPACRSAVREAGFAAAFATYDGVGRWALPRVDVNALDTARSFRLKTWPVYPGLRRALGAAPALRSGLHALVGTNGRDDDAS